MGEFKLHIIGLRPQDVTGIFKDREDKLSQLRELVCDPSAKLICIIGRSGIGKTALVCKLCCELEFGQLQPREAASGTGVNGIIYIDCREENRLTLERLFHDVGRLLGGSASDDLMNCWGDSSQSLAEKVRFLLGKLRQGFYLLMLDNFERLLGAERRFKDHELETFVDICLQAPHAMRIIATSRERMVLQGPGRRSARMLSLESGLPETDGISLLRDLDPDGRLGLRECPEELLRKAVQQCFGVPRALESIAGILDSDPMLSLDSLLEDTTLFKGQVVENLIAEHYRRLTDPQRRVLEALAVYNVPISVPAVDFVLKPFFPDLDASSCLCSLVQSYVVTYRRGCNEYQLHPLDQKYAYEMIPDHDPEYNKQACHRRAAEFYQQMRKPKEEWQVIEDITPQLQEVYHLGHAGAYDQACSIINEIDYDYLFRWGFYKLIILLRSHYENKLVDLGLRVDNLAGLGIAYHYLGEEDQALKYLNQGLQMALEIGDHTREITLRCHLGKVFYVQGEIESATEYLQQALVMAQKLGDDHKKARALSNLGLAHSTLGNYEKAIECYEQSLKNARDSGNRWEEGIRLSGLGQVYYNLLDMKKAQECFEEALSIARQVGNRKGEAIRLRGTGRIYHSLGQVSRAREYYLEALEISREIGHQRGIAISLIWLGRAYHHLGDTQKAIEQYELALKACRATQYHRGESMTLGDLGRAYQGLGDLVRATELYEDALVIARRINIKKTLSELLLVFGNFHLRLSHLCEAIKCYKEALSMDVPSTNYSCAIRLGFLLLGQDKKEEADKYLNHGLHACRRLLERAPEFCQALYVLALGQVGSGQINEALASYQRALEVCSARGVIQGALDDLDLLKHIPKFVDGVEQASQLLLQVLTGEKESARLRPEKAQVSAGTDMTGVETLDNRQQAELERIFATIKKNDKDKRTDPYTEIIGRSHAIGDILKLIDKVKDTNSTVLITGETGTGKELVAHAIHQNSPRSNAPFVALNLGAVPDHLMESELFGHKKGAFTGAINDKKGMFEVASGGTIFLDEIGSMKKDGQVKLLRVLQERRIQPVGGTEEIPIDVRVIVATQKDLERAVTEGEFREDLFYRINTVRIHVPALRERKEDIPQLVEHFITRLCKDMGKKKKHLSKKAMQNLLLYNWPGNVRQLASRIENAILLVHGDLIEPNHIVLPQITSRPEPFYSDEQQRQLIISTLRKCRTVAEAIRRLGLSKSTFYDKVKRYGINPKSFLTPTG